MRKRPLAALYLPAVLRLLVPTALVALAAVPAGAGAQEPPPLTPTCVAPGASVTYATTLPSDIGPSIALRWRPSVVGPNSDVADFTRDEDALRPAGTLPATLDAGGRASASGPVAVPSARSVDGQVVDGWLLEASRPTGAPVGAFGVLELAGRRLYAPTSTPPGSQVPLTARGFGDQPAYVTFSRRGRVIRRATLKPAADTTPAPCGTARGEISARTTLDLRPGRYVLALSATRTGAPIQRRSLRLSR